MKPNGKALFLIIVLGVITLACNLPTAVSTEAPVQATEPPAQLSPEDIAATYVAQTATAQSASSSGSPSPTSTPDSVTATVSVATNCRTGPDVNYSLLMVVQPGSTMQVVGKYTPKTYWIINMPTGGTCWLWGQYASISGNPAPLPEIAAPPPPVVVQSSDNNSNSSNNSDNSGDSNSDSSNDNSSVVIVPVVPIGPFLLLPAAPTNLDISRTCVTLTKPGDLFPSFQQTTTFTWTDASSNETGFNVFKDGVLLATVSANAQQYIDKFTVLLPQSSTASYGVQAVGQNGNSSTKSISVQYCK